MFIDTLKYRWKMGVTLVKRNCDWRQWIKLACSVNYYSMSFIRKYQKNQGKRRLRCI